MKFVDYFCEVDISYYEQLLWNHKNNVFYMYKNNEMLTNSQSIFSVKWFVIDLFWEMKICICYYSFGCFVCHEDMDSQ